MMTKGVIAPTGAQLNAAIEEEMTREKKKTLSVKDLQAKLLEHHPNWKIPERRVKKFLKRHLSQHANPAAADDDDDATMTTASSSKGPAAKRLLKFFKFTVKNKRKSTATQPQSTPEAAPTAPQDPIVVGAPEEGSNSKVDSERNLEDQIDDSQFLQSDQIIEQTRSLEQVYSDDNDGKKNDCHCSESCVIL